MTHLTIFDVEHGACSLLTAANGRMMIDCGRKVSSGWTPARHLEAIGVRYLDMLAITNYDEDHVDGLPELLESTFVGALWRTKNVVPDDIVHLKSDDGMGPGIAALVEMAKSYSVTLPNPPVFDSVQYEMFCNDGFLFRDENNLSAVIKLTIHGVGVLFTGDMERAGFDALLQRSDFRAALSNIGILVAPHHGRECSVHEGFLSLVRPFWTVISDKGYMYSSQETVPTYAKYSRGAPFRGSERRVLTTRNDGSMSFIFTDGGWDAY
jgi:beta-lactamase superfamily II metal-dependent hydrolase